MNRDEINVSKKQMVIQVKLHTSRNCNKLLSQLIEKKNLVFVFNEVEAFVEVMKKIRTWNVKGSR